MALAMDETDFRIRRTHWIVTETESDRHTVTAGDDRVKSHMRFLRSLVMTEDDRG